MPAPLVSALNYLLTPLVARQVALRAGMPEEAAPSGVASGTGALASLYGLYAANTNTPDDLQRLLYGTGPAYDPRNYLDPSFEDSMRALQEERDRAMDYGYAYPQSDTAKPTPMDDFLRYGGRDEDDLARYLMSDEGRKLQSYGQTEQPATEVRFDQPPGGANGGLAALLRRKNAKR